MIHSRDYVSIYDGHSDNGHVEYNVFTSEISGGCIS